MKEKYLFLEMISPANHSIWLHASKEDIEGAINIGLSLESDSGDFFAITQMKDSLYVLRKCFPFRLAVTLACNTRRETYENILIFELNNEGIFISLAPKITPNNVLYVGAFIGVDEIKVFREFFLNGACND